VEKAIDIETIYDYVMVKVSFFWGKCCLSNNYNIYVYILLSIKGRANYTMLIFITKYWLGGVFGAMMNLPLTTNEFEIGIV
jgi:hypothetical protein